METCTNKIEDENVLTDYYICENAEICQSNYCTHMDIHKMDNKCETTCGERSYTGCVHAKTCRRVTIAEYAVYRLKGNEK